jgi:predicted nucleotidyltransferase
MPARIYGKRKIRYMNIIKQYQKEITEACGQYEVKKLYIFGSVLTEEFSRESDVDFLVDFDREGFRGSFKQFMGFKKSLEEILGRNIDLISVRSIRNPVFLSEINQTRKLIYAS